MRIQMLTRVMSGRGVFEKGAEVDWPDKDAKPLVDSGAAKVVKPKAEAKPKAAKKKRGKK